MSGYDSILSALQSTEDVGFGGSNMTIGVDEGDLDLAIRIIEYKGGVVTGTNSHEAGHTIYFEA
jgi:hypothetical protein